VKPHGEQLKKTPSYEPFLKSSALKLISIYWLYGLEKVNAAFQFKLFALVFFLNVSASSSI
jgi:hypothetical protein